MILVDMNQVSISSIMVQINRTKNSDINLIRHLILNTIRSVRSRFHREYGELVLCYDSSNNWRRDYYSYYKHSRKEGRSKSSLDWDEIFNNLSTIQKELIDNFPYKVIKVDRAEGDDVIAVLANNSQEKVVIISSDKDFKQLLNNKIQQYNLLTKKFVEPEEGFLMEQVIRGDKSDGVPNILSADDSFAKGVRQTPISKKKLEGLKESILFDFVNLPYEVQRNYERNNMLINLSMIPEPIQNDILMEYKYYKVNNRSGLLNYFIKNRLSNLTENITEF